MPNGTSLYTKWSPAVPGTGICDLSSPAWSPDAKRIAFAQAYPKLEYIDGVEWIEVGAPVWDSAPDWGSR